MRGQFKSLKSRSDYGSGQFSFLVIVVNHFDMVAEQVKKALRFQPRILKVSFPSRLSAIQTQIGQDVKIKKIYEWFTNHCVLCKHHFNK